MQSSRLCAILMLALGLIATGAAFYLQYMLKQLPCDLCMLQRLALYGVMLFSLMVLLFNPRRWMVRINLGFSFLCAVGGLALAGRHMYLQALPEALKPSCGPGLDDLIQQLPLLKVLEHIIRGSGECAQVQALFLGHALPFWTAILFIVLAFIAIMGIIKA